MPLLTPRQQQIYEHLRRQGDSGAGPSLDTLCRELGLRSRGSLHKHIQALVAAGLVAPLEGRRRGVRLTGREEGPPQGARLPFLGYIAAGRPIEAVSNPNPVDLPGFLLPKGAGYVLQVRGDSMTDEGILDGDWIVVEHRDHARDGEIVVALIDGGDVTLKRIEQRSGQVILHAANGAYPPMAFSPERVRIQGVLAGLWRKY